MNTHDYAISGEDAQDTVGLDFRYRICDMPARLRPREAMERQGVEHVSEVVLLAILLRSGGARFKCDGSSGKTSG